MIAQGHDMNLQTKESLSTPLVAALKKGKLEIVHYLISVGCNTDISTVEGDSPLHIAVITNNENALLALLNCSNVNRQPINHLGQTVLHNAVQYNHIRTLLPVLLGYATNDYINQLDINGNNALCVACKQQPAFEHIEGYHPLENVQLLLEAHADPNQPNSYGETSLHAATNGQITSIVLAVLQFGADVHARTIAQGETPLHIAASKESNEIVQILINNNSDINAKDNDGFTVFHNVQETEILQSLLYAIDEKQNTTIDIVNSKDAKGNTPLHMIARLDNNLDMIQCLVDAHANINATNDDGRSCLHICANNSEYNQNHFEALQRLVYIGVNVLIKDIYDRTAAECLPLEDKQSREYLQGVIDDCLNPGYKRSNTNTNNDETESENDFNMDFDDKTEDNN
jgi:ankyrin repeat protein